MRKNHRVFELCLVFKYAREKVGRGDMGRVYKSIKRWARAAKHSENSQSIVIVTNESQTELMDRIGPDLDKISVIEDCTCQHVPLEVWGKNGTMCPFRSRVWEAWAEAGKMDKTQHYRQRRPRKPVVKDGVENLSGSTSVKVQMRLARQGKFLPNANRPKR